VKKCINIFRASSENRNEILNACNTEQNENIAIIFNISITCLKQQYDNVRRMFLSNYYFFVAQQPLVGHGLLFIDCLLSHSDTPRWV